jgi:hypothetical protein
MNITAAVVPARSAAFEIETLDLAAPLADEVLVRVVASGMCHTDCMPAMAISRTCPIQRFAAMRAPVLSSRLEPPSLTLRPATRS